MMRMMQNKKQEYENGLLFRSPTAKESGIIRRYLRKEFRIRKRMTFVCTFISLAFFVCFLLNSFGTGISLSARLISVGISAACYLASCAFSDTNFAIDRAANDFADGLYTVCAGHITKKAGTIRPGYDVSFEPEDGCASGKLHWHIYDAGAAAGNTALLVKFCARNETYMVAGSVLDRNQGEN